LGALSDTDPLRAFLFATLVFHGLVLPIALNARTDAEIFQQPCSARAEQRDDGRKFQYLRSLSRQADLLLTLTG
jgi:hypothetical protein